MLACRIHAKEDLRVEPADMPDVGAGEVLLRLGAGGICGSDLHYYFEGRNGSFVVREPLIPGHEASARRRRRRAGRHARQGGRQGRGQPVACVRPLRLLPRGPRAAVPNMKFLGSASLFPHVQGMFREYFVMGERQCYPVAGDVSLGELAFAEPLAVGLHAVNRGGELLGKSVLVTGAGTIGCLTRAGGAARRRAQDHRVATCSIGRSRRRAMVGADVTLRADRDGDALATPQFDVCYEVSGSFAALKTCVAAAKRGGVVVQVGTLPHEPLPFVVNELMAKELDLRGAFRWGIEFDWAVDYLSSRRVDVRPLLSGQYPLQRRGRGVRTRRPTRTRAPRCRWSRLRRHVGTRIDATARSDAPKEESCVCSRSWLCVAVAAAALAAGGPALAQQKLKWAHVYETSRAVPQAVGLGRRRDQEAHQRQVRHPGVPGVVARQGNRHQPGPDARHGRHDHQRRRRSPRAATRALGIAYYPFIFRDADHLLAYSQERRCSRRWPRVPREDRHPDPRLHLLRRAPHHRRNRPFTNCAGMKGLKIRVPDVPAYMATPKACGANPTPIAFAEVYLALQNGTVDAQENPLPTIEAKKFYEVQKHIMLTGHIVDGLTTAGRAARLEQADRRREEDLHRGDAGSRRAGRPRDQRSARPSWSTSSRRRA